ncbi:MAG: dockerin type I domain-containing protein, partial [Planctomycetota bacterium]
MFRRLLLEQLEDRRLLAVDWRNPVNSLDVSGDGSISPIDPLQVINELNLSGSHALADQRPTEKPYWDASGDQFVSPLDALQVINALNENRTVPYVLSEGQQIAAEQSITITVGQAAGTRIYRLEVIPAFAASATPSSSQDLFAIYLVDPQQPDQTLLDRGTPGTTLFTLSATGAEFAPGRVRWDGEVVEIDLSAVTDRDTAELRLQLLNGNGDGASRVTVKPLSNDVNAEG